MAPPDAPAPAPAAGASRLTPRARAALAAAGWAVAVAAVVIVARTIGWRDALAAVRRAEPAWVAAAVACHAGIVALWACQTLVLLPPRRPPYGRLFEVQALSAAAVNTAPAFVGHAAGVALLAERGGVGVAAALGVLAQHGLAEGVAKLAMLLAAARVAPLPGWMRGAVSALVVGVLLLAATLAVAVWAGRRGMLTGTAGTGGAGVVRRMLGGARGLAARWAAVLDAPGARRRLGAAVVIALGMKSCEAAGWWCVERALGVAPRPGSALLALAATNLASSIPSSPGNVGVYEGAAYSAYRGLLGVARDDALALALVGHACYLVPMVGMGWALLLVAALGRRRRR